MRILTLALVLSVIAAVPAANAQTCRVTKSQAQVLGIQAVVNNLAKTAGASFELKGVRFPSVATTTVDYLEGASKACWRATYSIKLDEKCQVSVHLQETVSCF